MLHHPGRDLAILDEESLLRSDLPGYSEYAQSEYAQHVRCRLVPFVW